jgi:signal transduction histidine kinase/ligand-binding sensor domain-containing protein
MSGSLCAATNRLGLISCVLVVSQLVVTDRVSAERLPITHFTIADGLPHTNITRVVQDSRGFIWICTPGGLSRFDGQTFTNYGVDDGLPHISVTDLLEVEDVHWIATNGGGVARFDTSETHRPSGPSGALFSVFAVGDTPATNRVNVLYRDRGGTIWAGTDGGLFQRSRSDAGFVRVPLHLSWHPDPSVQVWALVEDESGVLWIGSRFGLLRRAPDGQVAQYTIRPEGATDHVWAVLAHEKRLWLGHDSGLIVFRPPSAPLSATNDLQPRSPAQSNGALQLPDAPGEARRYQPIENMPVVRVQALARSSSGAVWIGTLGGGLAEFHHGRFSSYTRAHGLDDPMVYAVAEDRGGNIWAGTRNGTMRIARAGFVVYSEAEGLGPWVAAVFERDGTLYATSHEFRVSKFDGKRFVTVKPRLPPHATGFRSLSVLLDRAGDWWFATRHGVFRFARVDRFERLDAMNPTSVYMVREGLADNDVSGLFEDRQGDIWMAHFAPGDEVLTRWERATGVFHRYSSRHGLRPTSSATAFAQDAKGHLWIGFRDGEVVRYEPQHFIQELPPMREPDRRVNSIHEDGQGRIWVSILGWGLVRIDTRAGRQTHVRLYSTSDGLASNNAGVLAEDGRGDIYVEVGERFGIDKLDTRTNRIRHFTSSDGVPPSDIMAAWRDRSGDLWFATTMGLLRFTPGSESPSSLPVTRIASLRIDDEAVSVPPLGSIALGPYVLGPGRNRLELTFFGTTPNLDANLRYQYRLEGTEADWSAPTAQQTVTFASLAPGRYRFLVRAVNTDGGASETPASLVFNVLPPIWQRWWFLSLAAFAVAAAAYAVHRARMVRVIELERVRTRIATDLHDDIGSGLSQVAVLTEVLRRRVGSDPAVSEPLSAVGEISRGLVDSMSEIVWAINPRRDHISDLTHRMRRFASEVLGARDIELQFTAPDDRRDSPLGPDVRREVWLIFKEGVNNSARHAACTRVSIDCALDSHWLELSIRDNGRGFDPKSAGDGNGLSSMRQRAARLGGTLTIVSDLNEGTTLTVRAPVGARSRRRAGSR